MMESKVTEEQAAEMLVLLREANRIWKMIAESLVKVTNPPMVSSPRLVEASTERVLPGGITFSASPYQTRRYAPSDAGAMRSVDPADQA